MCFVVFNSLWPCDAIWHHRSWSTLVQVIACCLMAPSHYLNQCGLIISEVSWHSHFAVNPQDMCPWYDLIKVFHDDVIKWKHFPRCWPFVLGIHRSPVNSPHKGQWRGALMFSLICAWINRWVNNREAGDLRRYRAHYDVIVMIQDYCYISQEPMSSRINSTKYLPLNSRIISQCTILIWGTHLRTSNR